MANIEKNIKNREAMINALYQWVLINKTAEEQFEEGTLDSDQLELLARIMDKYEEMQEFFDSNLKEGWRLDKLATPIQAILMNAYYEIKFTNLDKKISINEAIIYSESYVPGADYKFVNAVLDKVSKNETTV